MTDHEYLQQLAIWPKDLAFPTEEYLERIAKVRAEMKTHELDVLLVTTPASLCYLAGYSTFGSEKHVCLVVPLDGPLAIQVATSESPATIVTGYIPEVVAYGWHEMHVVPGQIASLVSARTAGRGRIGVELRKMSLSIHIYSELQKLLPSAQFVDASEIMAAVRVTKSPREIEYMRQAAKVSALGIAASLKAIAVGKTDNDVAAAGYEAMIRAGGEFFGFQPVVAAGYRSSFVHGTFKRSILKQKDAVLLEYGGVYQRYIAPMSRTAIIGEASVVHKSVAAAVEETMNLVLTNVRAGRVASEIAAAAAKGHRALRDWYFAGVYAYSVGAGLPPTWNEQSFAITDSNHAILRSGMTLHVVPFLRSPAHGFGIGFSETIAITDRGCEVLTDTKEASLPRELVVV